MILSRGQAHMLLATLLFSLMGVLVKHLHRIPAHEVVFFRAWVSVLLGYAWLRQRGLSPWGNRRALLLARGAAGTAALLLYFHTLQVMPLASAVTVQYLSPLFTLLLAGVLLGERASPRQWAGFTLSFVGVALLKGFDPRVSLASLLLGVAAAGCSGLAYTLVRRLRGSDDPLVVVFYFPLVTLPVVGPYTLAHWVWPAGWEWGWLLSVGVLTQLAQVCLTQAYHLERADAVSHLTYTGAPLALALGFVFFGETLPLPAAAGIAVVVAGVLLSQRGAAGSRPDPAALTPPPRNG